MDEKVSNHPCHRLSIPSAKLFWCRHCMQSFEDPINRWRHSKTCKTGGPSNHDKRLEQEPFALQTYVETREKEVASQSQLVDSSGEELVCIKTEDAIPRSEYSCFICKRPFDTLDDMKEHVKYPCSKATDEPLYIPGSGGTYIEATYPNASMTDRTMKNIIQRQMVEGEIVEQSADPETGVRTFEVHSQNDDVPLSEILSRLSESGYLVAGEMESPVSQVIVVQQVDEKGQIIQSEHILPPHIQIQNNETSKGAEGQESEMSQVAIPDGVLTEAQPEEITYYVTESGELIDPANVQVKQEPEPKELFYGSYDSQSGMNILTQAAEATIGNLIKQEKRRNEEEEEEEEKVKRSRTQCRPEEEVPYQRPHSPRSPRGPGNGSFGTGTAANGTSTSTIGNIIKADSSSQDSGGNETGKQQTNNHVNDENIPLKEATVKKPKASKEKKPEAKKWCSRSYSPESYKCRICDKVFKTSQLLNKHSQYPCKVFNTRNMCQKILRPKRAIGRNSEIKSVPTVKSNRKAKPTTKFFRKPILLLDGLKVFPNLLNEKRMKPKAIKKRIVYSPTPPRLKSIWLPDKPRLLVEDLSDKEQFFYEFGLVSVRHLMSFDSSVDEDEIKELEDECQDLFTPLSVSTEIGCLKNSEIVDDLNYLPPVLERMDSAISLDEDELLDEPPILSPILDITVKESDQMHSDEINSETKSSNPKRHFTDLFVEASPETCMSSQPQSDSGVNPALVSAKPYKDVLSKTAAISELANKLKQKLSSPQHQTSTSTKNLDTKSAKQNLLTSFSNLSSSSGNQASSNTNVQMMSNSGLVSHRNTDKNDLKKLSLPIVKNQSWNGLKSPSKISVVLYKKNCKEIPEIKNSNSENQSSICKSHVSDSLKSSNKEMNVKKMASDSKGDVSKTCDKANTGSLSTSSTLHDTDNVSVVVDEEEVLVNNQASEQPSEESGHCFAEEKKTSTQTGSEKETVSKVQEQLQKDKKQTFPPSLPNVKSPFTSISFPKYLYDEGIVEDIHSKSDGSIWGKDLQRKREATLKKNAPRVMVQYLEQVNSLVVSDDRLSSCETDNEFDISSHKTSSPDYLARKLALCEEEVILSDSGLDDSDEIILPSCMEAENVMRTVKC